MPVLVYSLLRIVMFVAAYALLALVGLRGWLLIIGAVVVAALMSFLVLPRQADAAAGVLARRAASRGQPTRVDRAIAVDEDTEDALVEDADHGRPAPGARSDDDRAAPTEGPGSDRPGAGTTS